MVCEGLKCDLTKSTLQLVYSCATKILDSDLFRLSLINHSQEYLNLIVVTSYMTEDYDAFMKIIASIKGFYSSLIKEKNEFVTRFVRHVLFPVLKLYNDIKSVLLVMEKVTLLTTTLVTTLQQILFPEQDSMKRIQYLTHLFSDGENVYSDNNFVLSVIISELHVALKKFPSSLCVSGFCIILKSFISVHRTDCAAVINFLRVYFHLVGLTSEVGCQAEDRNLNLNVSVLHRISNPSKLKAVSYAVIGNSVKTLTEINFVAEGDSEMYLVSLLVELCLSAVQKSKRQNMCAECLDMCSSVIKYAPVATASRIFEFLVPVMLLRKGDDIELSISYLGFLHCALELFLKLSRIQKLFTKLLPLIKDAALEVNEEVDLSDVLPKNFCKQLCMKVMQLPSQQILSIMKSFCYHLQEDCFIPLVQRKLDCVPQLYMQVLARLISTFLLGVRVACHTVPLVTMLKFAAQLAELEEILGRYAAALNACRFEENQVVGLLEICYSVGELRLVLANYRPHTCKVDMSQCDTSIYNFAGLHPYIRSDQWNIIAQRINATEQSAAKEMFNDLLLQKLVALQLFGVTGDICVQQSHIAQHFVSVQSVHLAKLVSSLPLLAQLLDKQQFLSLARGLFQLFASHSVVHTSLLTALQHEAICEARDVVETLVWMTVGQIGSIVAQFVSDEIEPCPFQSQEKLAMFFLKRFSGHETCEDALSSMLASVGSLVTLACKGSDVFRSDGLKEMDMKMLEWNVNILRVLPITSMPLDIQSLAALTAVLGATCLLSFNQNNVLIDVLCGDILLGLVENTKALNLSMYLHIGYFLSWLFGIGADLDKQRHRLLFRKLFDNHLGHKGELEDLQPLLSSITVVDCSHERSFGVLSALLSSLCKYNKKQLNKKEAFIHKNILLPVMNFIEIVKLEHHELHSTMLEVFANMLVVELGMTRLDVTKLYLTDFINIALTGLCSEDDGLAQNCMLFIKVVLQHYEKLSNLLPQNFVHMVWATSSTHITEQQGKLVVEAASDEEFNMIITSLLDKSKDSLTYQSPFGIQLLWWKCVVSCSLPAGKCAVRQAAVETLCTCILASLDHCHQEIVEILRMEEAFISNPQVRMGPYMLDLCLLSISSIPSSVVGEEFARVWPAMLSVLHHLHTHSSVLLWDRLPSVLQCYMQLLSSLAAQSNIKRNLTCLEIEHISTCALGLTKFTNSLGSSSHHLKQVCPYLIADILHEMEKHNVHVSVKVHFQNCLNHLISMSDLNRIAYLLRVLKPADSELFKSTYKKYKKYFQFTGKI